MSDEEDESFSSPEEGFSASEDEWKPTKETRGGESSDDDDSDFDGVPTTLGSTGAAGAANRRREPKGRSAIKQQAAKKRKSSMQSLRSKLYNKYKPPPKTLTGRGDNNSPSASTSKALSSVSKNSGAPNDDSDNDDVSSESSGDDYLVNPAELDLKSSFFDVGSDKKRSNSVAPTPPPQFDCNAGAHLSDSDSEDNNDTSGGDEAANKAFDFRNLMEKATSLERVKETIAKRAAASAESHQQAGGGTRALKKANAAMDVESLLALGENQNQAAADDKGGRQKLRQTKSTRQKRHTKTRPASGAGAGANSEDSDWEEVADEDRSYSDDSAAASSKNNSSGQAHDFSRDENLEIHIEMPNRQRSSKDRKQQDLEAALKRKINRDIKDRQMLLHKTSLLCCFARSYLYNRLLNETALMNEALKLLPSKNSYPPERGTELKYYRSLVLWFKTAIKLKSNNLYPAKALKRGKENLKQQLCEQLKKKEASCKQDMIFMFVILLRGMGLQCRLVVNMQPLPIRPSQSDLCKITLKKPDDDAKGGAKSAEKSKKNSKDSNTERTLSSENEEIAKKKSTKTSSEKTAHKNKELAKESYNITKINEKNATRAENKKKKEKTNKTNDIEESLMDIKEEKPNLQLVKEDIIEKQAKKNELPYVNDIKIKLEQIIGQKLSVAKSTKTEEQTELKESSDNELAKPTKRANSQKKPSVAKETEQINEEVETEETEQKATNAQGKRQRVAKKSTANAAAKEQDQNQLVDKSKSMPITKPSIAKLKRSTTQAVEPSASADSKKPKLNEVSATPIARRTRYASSDQHTTENQKPVIEIGSPVLPKAVRNLNPANTKTKPATSSQSTLSTTRDTRSKSKSPKPYVSTEFLHTKANKEQPEINNKELLKPNNAAQPKARSKSPNDKVKISPNFLKKNSATPEPTEPKRVLRSRQKPNEVKIPQLDGADDVSDLDEVPLKQRRKPQLKKLQNKTKHTDSGSDDADFEPSPTKKPKVAPVLKAVERLRKDRRVLSTDDEAANKANKKIDPTATDMWIEVWSDVEDQWICVDLFKGKLDEIDVIRRSATSSFAYVYAFQNDLSLKDITARYCPHWTTTVRKSRVDKAWLDVAISSYIGNRTKRDMCEDVELRRIHEEKPMPTTISDYKDHPLYALERHLLKFQALYPPNAPTLGFIRGEPVYARECVHTLHSREIWLKQARTVKLGEQPYKIVKARPKWDRITQTVIKDQPLEIFGYWQTQDYEPPTAEHGLVPRNAYGNVELFKECMLPKKTVHLRLPGLNRVCKKLGIDCANAVIGFDFHQGACHPTYDGFVICEEFAEAATSAWEEDQENQERKEQEKYESRVYGNWKKLIRGLLIRERLKKKYNF